MRHRNIHCKARQIK